MAICSYYSISLRYTIVPPFSIFIWTNVTYIRMHCLCMNCNKHKRIYYLVADLIQFAHCKWCKFHRAWTENKCQFGASSSLVALLNNSTVNMFASSRNHSVHQGLGSVVRSVATESVEMLCIPDHRGKPPSFSIV